MQIKSLPAKILFKNAQIVDPFQEKVYQADILIEKGKIKAIEPNLPAPEQTVVESLSGLTLAPGLIDMHTHLREPGYEAAETIESGARAALAGGFTTLCCMPNTDPPIDSQESVRFIYKKAEETLIRIYPIAAITKNRKGEELTEMVELATAGAVAFSDDGTPLQRAQMMRNALEYAQLTGKPIINHAEDLDLKGDGLMNEGIVSTQVGLPGNPALAEELMVYRDLRLAEFTGGKLHIPHVSTAGAVDLIRQAKRRGLEVTAEVTPHHLSLTDEYLRTFDTNAKVSPPLRTEADRQALIAGLQDGTLEVIATDHAPHVVDTKETSFDLAASGMIGLESALALLLTQLVIPGHLSLLQVIKMLTVNPARILGLEPHRLAPGQVADLIIFDPEEWWVFNRKDIYSRSQNTPFIGTELIGRVKAVITKGHQVII